MGKSAEIGICGNYFVCIVVGVIDEVILLALDPVVRLIVSIVYPVTGSLLKRDTRLQFIVFGGLRKL